MATNLLNKLAGTISDFIKSIRLSKLYDLCTPLTKEALSCVSSISNRICKSNAALYKLVIVISYIIHGREKASGPKQQDPNYFRV